MYLYQRPRYIYSFIYPRYNYCKNFRTIANVAHYIIHIKIVHLQDTMQHPDVP